MSVEKLVTLLSVFVLMFSVASPSSAMISRCSDLISNSSVAKEFRGGHGGSIRDNFSYYGIQSIDLARMTAEFLRNQGKPLDLELLVKGGRYSFDFTRPKTLIGERVYLRTEGKDISGNSEGVIAVGQISDHTPGRPYITLVFGLSDSLQIKIADVVEMFRMPDYPE